MGESPWKRFRLGIKRAIDIIVSGGLLVILSPVWIVVSILIFFKMGSPVIFRQKRPGLHGEIFTVKKFRTMSTVLEKDGRVLTDAERMGSFGSTLRKTSLDEIPQLWNVLCGDMSLIGPRPLLVEYLQKYTPEQMRRHDVRPGITGWAQIHGRRGLKFSERFVKDVWYVDNWSLLLDLKILLATIGAVFKRKDAETGAYVGSVDDLGLIENILGDDKNAPH